MPKITTVTGYDRYFGPVFTPGTALRLQVTVESEPDRAAEAFVQWSLRDLFGDTREARQPLRLAAPQTIAELTIPLPEPGAFDLTIEVLDPTYATLAAWHEKLAVIPEPGPVPLAANALGVNLAAHTPDGVRVTLALARRAGIGWARLWNPLWFRVAPEPGRFAWEEMDAITAILEASGVAGVAVLGLAPAWALTTDAAGRRVPVPEHWDAYVHAIVSRYHRVWRYWELWNEPDISGFGPWADAPEACASLLTRAYPIIKRIDPDLHVLYPGIQGCKPEWASRYLDAGGAAAGDLANTHAYWGPDWPAVSAILKDCQARRPGLRWWLTEMGKQLDDRDQARFLVRNWLKALSLGADKVFWHCISQQVDGFALYYRETPGETLRGDDVGAFGKVRTGLVALAALGSLLPPGARFIEERRVGGATVMAFVLPDGSQLCGTWTLTRPVVVELPAASDAELIDLVGRRQPLAARHGQVSVAATADPVYVLIPP